MVVVAAAASSGRMLLLSGDVLCCRPPGLVSSLVGHRKSSPRSGSCQWRKAHRSNSLQMTVEDRLNFSQIVSRTWNETHEPLTIDTEVLSVASARTRACVCVTKLPDGLTDFDLVARFPRQIGTFSGPKLQQTTSTMVLSHVRGSLIKLLELACAVFCSQCRSQTAIDSRSR